jgi:isocitrate dehydrogenase (NAD+)
LFVERTVDIEGEYSGLEHEVVPDVVESLKVNTRAASMRIAEFVFYYAATQNRRKVSASHKATADPLAFQKAVSKLKIVGREHDLA